MRIQRNRGGGSATAAQQEAAASPAKTVATSTGFDPSHAHVPGSPALESYRRGRSRVVLDRRVPK
ncbi:hypothetical protein ACWGQ5_16375 [Streptomyces sp. NPDC055722]